MKRSWLFVPLIAGLGCPVGPHAGGFDPATGGAGISVVITTEAGRSPDVELLAVRDTALLVLSRSRVTLVPYPIIRNVRVHQRGHLNFKAPGPTHSQRDELKLLSRYPQGVSPELLQRLLAAYEQSELVVVQR